MPGKAIFSVVQPEFFKKNLQYMFISLYTTIFFK